MINANNGKNLATVWKVVSSNGGSFQWLVGWTRRFSKKLKLRFGSKINCCRLQSCETKPSSWVFSLLCFVDFKAPIHDYPSRVIYIISKTFSLTSKRIKPVKISYMFQQQIKYDKRQKRKTLAGPPVSFTVKACSVKNWELSFSDVKWWPSTYSTSMVEAL